MSRAGEGKRRSVNAANRAALSARRELQATTRRPNGIGTVSRLTHYSDTKFPAGKGGVQTSNFKLQIRNFKNQISTKNQELSSRLPRERHHLLVLS